MENILLTVLILVTLAMCVTILLQRSEGGALGIGGGGGAGGMMSARGAADFLSRSTKWLAIIFLATALALNWLAARKRDELGASVDIAAQEEVLPDPAESSEPDLPTIPDEDG